MRGIAFSRGHVPPVLSISGGKGLAGFRRDHFLAVKDRALAAMTRISSKSLAGWSESGRLTTPVLPICHIRQLSTTDLVMALASPNHLLLAHSESALAEGVH